jgi:hypothetical protein
MYNVDSGRYAEPFSHQAVNSLPAIIPYHDRCLHSCTRLVSSNQEVTPANREVMNYDGHKIFPTRTLNCLPASPQTLHLHYSTAFAKMKLVSPPPPAGPLRDALIVK